MALEVRDPGLATTIQDRGRLGYYRFGIPAGGSLDQYSAGLANRVLGNSPDAAVLEAAYLGPRLVATEPVTVAVAGAPVEVRVNSEPHPAYARIELQAGDELSFGRLQGGVRFYLAVAGGFDVPATLGSRSTYAIGRIGGVGGRALAAGDVLPIGTDTSPLAAVESIPDELRPSFDREVEVRVVLGLYHHLLSEEGARNLIEAEWTLTPVADRMGMRYDGPGVTWRERAQPFGAGQDPSNIVDAGYPVGSIQLPGGTQPIVLHRDAVSAGGYAQAATVISVDLDVVARSAPGTKTRFLPVTLEQAVAARRDHRARWNRIWS